MCYEAILNETIIDAFQKLECVKYNKRSRLVLRCSEKDEPEGIISARTGWYYHVDGWPEFPDTVDSGGTVTLTEIDTDTYNAVIMALDAGEPFTPEEPAEELDPNITLDFLIRSKTEEMNRACEKTIEDGFALEMSDGKSYQFTMKNEDQIAMMSIMARIQTGETEFDFYAGERQCLTLGVEDAEKLIATATAFRSYHVAYYRCLVEFIESLADAKKISEISYGDVVPEEFWSGYLLKYAAALGVAEYA